jgi:hypothetical protein
MRFFAAGEVIRSVPSIGNDLDAADFDQDGMMDLAYVAVGFPNLLILYGDGSGGFPRETEIRFLGTRDDWALYWTYWNIQICGLDTQIIRGDANQDDRVDIADAIRILGFLFKGAERVPCPDAADANDDGKIDIADSIRILFFLFGGDDEAAGTSHPVGIGYQPFFAGPVAQAKALLEVL